MNKLVDMSREEIAGTFAWYRGMKGFYCAKHPVGYQHPHDAKTPVAAVALGPSEFSLALAILEQRYPPPKETTPTKVKLESARNE